MDYTESLGITEISHRKNLPKSRVHRAVKTMEESGYLRQDPETRRYSLGFRAFKLGIAAARRFGAFPEIRMLLKRLALETKGSVSIRVADHNEMVIVEAIDSTDILRIHSPVGGRRPWDFGAGGKVASAHRPRKEVGELIKRSGIGQYTKFAVTSPARFMKELEKVRRQGYAVSKEEHVLGSFSAAAPPARLERRPVRRARRRHARRGSDEVQPVKGGGTAGANGGSDFPFAAKQERRPSRASPRGGRPGGESGRSEWHEYRRKP